VTLFDEIGGEPVLRAIIDDFVERVFRDAMIGFMFARASKERVKRFEFEHAAAFLGAGVAYGGRDLREAHKRHPIMGGQFNRRRQILKLTLDRHGVPEHVRDAWLAHQDALRGEITGDDLGACNEVAATARIQRREDEE
jgi:truncated hemoglobin YjbI